MRAASPLEVVLGLAVFGHVTAARLQLAHAARLRHLVRHAGARQRVRER